MRTASLGMVWIGWLVLVPLSFASLLTGLVQALGTEWGLFRYHWVLAKLLMNVFANVALLMFMQSLGSSFYMTSDAPPIHAVVALLLLLVATICPCTGPRLYHEIRGRDPLMVMVPGANGETALSTGSRRDRKSVV